MCTKKTIYEAGGKRQVILRARKRGEKLDFSQISYSTECVREIAARLEMPMAQAIDSIRAKNAFPIIYREARKTNRRPVKVVAQELIQQ